MTPAIYADKPWLKQYELMGIPAMEPTPVDTVQPIHQLLDEAARDFPDRTATIYRGGEMTYAQLKDKADRLATALAKLGVVKGDRVGTLMLSSPQFGLSLFGMTKAGAVTQSISALHKAMEIERQLQEAGTKVLITFDDHLDEVLKIRQSTSLEHIIVTSVDDFSAQESPEPRDYPGTLSLRKLIDSHPPQPPEIDFAPDDLASVVFTGGATGVPKGVMFRHSNLTGLLSAFPPMQAMVQPLRGQTSIIVSLHMFHIGLASYLMGIAMAATTAIVPDPRDTKQIYEYIRQLRPMFHLGAPSQWAKLLALEEADPDLLKGIIPLSGMTMLSPEIEKEYEKKVGTHIGQAYGMTETSAVITVNLPIFLSKFLGPGALHEEVPIDPTSVGLPTLGTELKIMDMDKDGKEVPIGEVGEIYVRGPQVMVGYWPTPGNGLTEDGWLNTGDCGYMNPKGYLYLTTRTKDMINVSGFKVYGKTVEDAVAGHPGVFAAAAVGVPDINQSGNERVKLFISLKQGFEATKEIEDEIINMCKENLAPYSVPRYLEFLDELPMMHTEKVDKKTLREREEGKGV